MHAWSTAPSSANISGDGDNEGLRVFARAPGAAKALIVMGLALTFIGFATFGSFIVRGIASEGAEGPDPIPAVPLGLGLFLPAWW